MQPKTNEEAEFVVEEDTGPLTERRPDLTKAYAYIMNHYPMVEEAE